MAKENTLLVNILAPIQRVVCGAILPFGIAIAGYQHFIISRLDRVYVNEPGGWGINIDAFVNGFATGMFFEVICLPFIVVGLIGVVARSWTHPIYAFLAGSIATARGVLMGCVVVALLFLLS